MTMIPVKEAAERFGVSPQTMRTWCKDGHVPGAEQQGRKWLVPEHAVPEGVRLPSRPAAQAPDTSELRPKTDEEIVAALGGGGPEPRDHERTYPHPDAEQSEQTPEPEEEPVTLDEVRESLAQMREALNTLGSLAGSLYGQVSDTLTMVEELIEQVDGPEDAYIPSPPDLVPGKDGPLLDDSKALEYLASGQSTTAPLETLDDLVDAEPEVEIDTDPREYWEATSHE